MNKSNMTNEQLAEWGREENRRRQSEMANVSSEPELKAVQAAVATRRKAIGLSAAQAARWVVVGQRLDRGESLGFALR